MSGKKAVDKVSKGLTSLIDEFSSAVKEMVNAGEETVVHLAVGSSRVIKAAVDATGEVTKITVETASNVVSSVTGGVAKAVSSKARQQNNRRKEEDMIHETTVGMMMALASLTDSTLQALLRKIRRTYEDPEEHRCPRSGAAGDVMWKNDSTTVVGCRCCRFH